MFLPFPNGKKIEKTASEFLVETVSQNPGGISILALGPLTNLALVNCLMFINDRFFAHFSYSTNLHFEQINL